MGFRTMNSISNILIHLTETLTSLSSNSQLLSFIFATYMLVSRLSINGSMQRLLLQHVSSRLVPLWGCCTSVVPRSSPVPQEGKTNVLILITWTTIRWKQDGDYPPFPRWSCEIHRCIGNARWELCRIRYHSDISILSHGRLRAISQHDSKRVDKGYFRGVDRCGRGKCYGVWPGSARASAWICVKPKPVTHWRNSWR